jgi:hypothetical protein
MMGELTEKESIARIDEILDNHYQDQFEILLYKKNSSNNSKLRFEFFSQYNIDWLCQLFMSSFILRRVV